MNREALGGRSIGLDVKRVEFDARGSRLDLTALVYGS